MKKYKGPVEIMKKFEDILNRFPCEGIEHFQIPIEHEIELNEKDKKHVESKPYRTGQKAREVIDKQTTELL